MNKNILFENCKKLISLYLHKGDTFSYPKEISIAKKILKICPDILFWEQYDISQRFHSLSIFLTKTVKKEIDKEYSMWKITRPKESIKLEAAPLINLDFNEKFKKQPKSLMEFIDERL